MSRLCFNHEVNDKTLELRQIQRILKRQNAVDFYIDDEKALELLNKTIELNPKHYKALYELGNYYLSMAPKEGDFYKYIPMADNYFRQSLEWASKVNDTDYYDLIKDKMASYEDWLKNK